MRKEGSVKRKNRYDEMEHGTVSASFRRPPYYLTAAGKRKKETGYDVRKETDGGTDVKKLGAG